MQKNEKNKYYSSVLAIVIGLIAIYLIFKTSKWVLIASIATGLVAIIIPFLARLIHYAWMGLGKILGLIISPIILSIVFFVILTPIALLKKLVTKTKPQQNTNFKLVNKEYSRKDFENPW
ncbi:MAG: hypothetical protein GX879_11540 [Bacteroidales bacterium]|nr:hypothetical protein [Bacteroidales bacterium]